ncbi:cytoplasmic polyadenylation element-binding protein 3 [Trichinella spiralis]|uniref:cytoplasmic polyadenylation element-binding protein 3 n=1 Tax=Trichinella spiralis TaxID=6334 RepID=UPI0001EFC77F|nr:cytoplasmic polyadenylation element-binding protein 3 [Trichinella spiralis]
MFYVTVRPWVIAEGICLSVLVSKTPFNAKAAQLAEAVEKIFPGVACVKILTDEMYDYPTGYARVFFTNENSYEKCISEQYVSLEFNDKKRRVKFIPFDEQLCHTGNFSQDNSRDVTLEAPTSQTATISLHKMQNILSVIKIKALSAININITYKIFFFITNLLMEQENMLIV